MSRVKTPSPTARGRRVPKNWKPVAGRAIAASALIALVLVTDVAETIADVSGAAGPFISLDARKGSFLAFNVRIGPLILGR